MRRLFSLSGLLLASVLLLAACEDDGDGDLEGVDTEGTVATTTSPTDAPTEATTETATATETETTTPTVASEGGDTLEITGVDYAFEGVPETVEAGTQLTFTNASDVEFHEMIMFRIPEGEDRPLAELLALPDEEAEQAVGAPVGVAVAMPGEDGQVVEGELIAEEPGRYILLCFIPVGADPEAFAEAMQNPGAGEPPQVEGGPPHVAEGMYAEFTVE